MLRKSFERPLLRVLRERLDGPYTGLLQVLTGPRQVGKTTLLLQFAANAGLPCRYATADEAGGDPDAWLRTQWTLGRADARGGTRDGRGGATAPSGGGDPAPGSGAVLLLDEVQQLPGWSATVKALHDEDRRAGLPLRVVLSGSSRLLLERGMAESLAGRFEVLRAGHWTWPEMRDAFGMAWDDYVWFGAWPGAVPLLEDEDRWRAYVRDALVDSVVHRDILQLTPVRKPALLRRLLDLGCRYSGQVLSYTKMLGQLQDAGNTVTLAHYLDLLDQAGLLGGLPKADASPVRQRASSPRLQVHNQALMSVVDGRERAALRANAVDRGRWVESAVGAHLLAAATGSGWTLGYWREGKHEVDYVLRRGERVLGLEVKSGRGGLGGGADAFRRRFPGAEVLLLGDSGMPIPEFAALSARDWEGLAGALRP